MTIPSKSITPNETSNTLLISFRGDLAAYQYTSKRKLTMCLADSLEAVRLVSRVIASPDQNEQSRRLQEITHAPGDRAKKLKPKSSNGISAAESTVLAEFPQQGIDLSSRHGGRMVSTALVFADDLCDMPISKHKAIIHLLRVGKLVLVYGIDPETKLRREFIVKS